MHTWQFFNPLLLRKSQRHKGLRGYGRIGYERFITYPREVRLKRPDAAPRSVRSTTSRRSWRPEPARSSTGTAGKSSSPDAPDDSGLEGFSVFHTGVRARFHLPKYHLLNVLLRFCFISETPSAGSLILPASPASHSHAAVSNAPPSIPL